jgi:hypothetical protein
MGDWLRLCRLLTNLVGNAERHADSIRRDERLSACNWLRFVDVRPCGK